MVGRRLSQYEILARVGEGGMGVVYKARDTRLERVAAIKILSADAVADPDRRRRFSQEARAASALNHPGIVTIYDIATDGNVCTVWNRVPCQAAYPFRRIATPFSSPVRPCPPAAI